MKITGPQLHEIHAHAAKAYPAECCGFLLGRGNLVYQTRRAVNQSLTPALHFVIASYEFAQASYAAEKAGLEIIGVYHSHPGGLSLPSPTDLDNAWREAFFLITSVYAGNPSKTQVWRLNTAGRFEEAPLDIVAQSEQNSTANK